MTDLSHRYGDLFKRVLQFDEIQGRVFITNVAANENAFQIRFLTKLLPSDIVAHINVMDTQRERGNRYIFFFFEEKYFVKFNTIYESLNKYCELSTASFIKRLETIPTGEFNGAIVPRVRMLDSSHSGFYNDEAAIEFFYWAYESLSEPFYFLDRMLLFVNREDALLYKMKWMGDK